MGPVSIFLSELPWEGQSIEGTGEERGPDVLLLTGCYKVHCFSVSRLLNCVWVDSRASGSCSEVVSPLGPAGHCDDQCPVASNFPPHSFGHLCPKFPGAIFPHGGLPLAFQVLSMWQLSKYYHLYLKPWRCWWQCVCVPSLHSLLIYALPAFLGFFSFITRRILWCVILCLQLLTFILNFPWLNYRVVSISWLDPDWYSWLSGLLFGLKYSIAERPLPANYFPLSAINVWHFITADLFNFIDFNDYLGAGSVLWAGR